MRAKKPFNSHNWLLSQLRRLSTKYPPKLNADKRAKTTYYIKAKNGNDVKRVSYTCAACGKSGIKSGDKEMDHIQPVGSFVDWNQYLPSLFCEEENFQCLCKECHAKKTAEETKLRNNS